MADPFEMVIVIVFITMVTGVIMRWMKLHYSNRVPAEMEEAFFEMQDEIDRLNDRVRRLESI